MKLCEHPDFDQAILQAADHFRPRGLRPSVIEKDYYVTEALRSFTTANVTQVTAAGSGAHRMTHPGPPSLSTSCPFACGPPPATAHR